MIYFIIKIIFIIILRHKIYIILLFAFSSVSTATKYYVSTSGSNGANGRTETTPWKTLTYAESHATAAGDTICLKRGDLWSTSVSLSITHGGNASHDIVWSGNQWGTGENTKISLTGNASNTFVVQIVSCDYVTFENITIEGNGHAAWGIVLGRGGGTKDGNYLTVQDCKIMNLGTGSDYCIAILVSPYRVNMSNITIRRNIINGITNHGIAFYPIRIDLGGNGSGTIDSYVGYNTITNCGLKGDGVADCIMIESNQQNTIVEHNVITQGKSNHVKGINFAGGVDGSPDGVIIRYNDVRMRNDQAFYSQNGYSPKGQIYYNLFYSSAMVNGHGTVEIGAWSYPGANFKFWNNVIIAESSTGAHAFNCATTTSGILELRNNIFYLSYGDVCANLNGGGVVHSNNSYYKPGSDPNYVWNVSTNIKKSRIISSWESTAQINDPLFVTQFTNLHLQAGSPCIDAGVNISLTEDYDGNLVPYNIIPDIGAYEYGAGRPPEEPDPAVVTTTIPKWRNLYLY